MGFNSLRMVIGAANSSIMTYKNNRIIPENKFLKFLLKSLQLFWAANPPFSQTLNTGTLKPNIKLEHHN